MKPIVNFSEFVLLVCLTGLALGAAYYFYPIENQPGLKSVNSSPKLANENFKHNARRIGGEAFPVPKIKTDQIAREPSINPSSINSKRQKKHVPVFSMPRPFVQDITTIKSGSITVTIAGVTPLPGNSQCTVDGKTKPCGKMARTALRALIRGRTILCNEPQSSSENEVITTSCKIGNIDIASWLVKHGWTTAAKGN